ncbi:restriction endonuclease subunit S [Pseudoalteromonas sp. JC3]|uniref:restriction endonuclease subunit S n=1 Tax=Pseudoalteromonas sp. JC3 TaxID=2810196 RepID=UPI0019D2D6F1|nr:restriction endonuclease subunit S [Pseudoalteromonas sp. JC3]MBR8845729.1 restriction endonuclease subunit S [Pseudoalteromonas sp. JC3]WJE09838.1 restriction endonuclease subunit S [Pseudoalteromonas sp. JC3]
MSELPKGWAESNFDDVCDYIQRGKSPKYVEYSDYPVVNQKAIRWFGIQEEHLKYINPEQWPKWDEQRYICIGDILWNSTGTGTIGRACHIDETQYTKAKVVDSHVTIVRTNKYIDSKFAFYWVMHPEIQGNINGLYNGSTNQVELSKKIVQSTKFLLAPLNEQKRIVEKLDDVLAQVDAIKGRLDSIPNIIKRFRQSVLANAVSGKLTQEWREGENFGVKVNLGSLILEGPQNGLYKPSQCYGSGVKILRIDSFYDGQVIEWDKIKLVELDDKEIEKYKLNLNDILVNRVNSIEYLGKCALIRSLPENAVFESNIMRMSIDTKKAIAEYLTLYLRSIDGLSQLRKNAKLAVNQASINQSDVKNCVLILPNLEEQKEIVRLVDEYFALADTIEAQVNKARARVDKLTQSILAKAFRGELVPQDDNDEPAEKLLERIAQAKAEAEALAKAVKKAEAGKKRAAKTISK